MDKLCRLASAIAWVPILFLSCQHIEDGDGASGRFDTLELYIGEVPADLVSIDWDLFDESGTQLAYGAIGPPLLSNQAIARYRGIPRDNMYMVIEPFLTGGTSCGIVQSRPFSSSAAPNDLVIEVNCGTGEGEFSTLLVVTGVGPTMEAEGLDFSSNGTVDSLDETVTYVAEHVDEAYVGHQLLLFWPSDGSPRLWDLNTSTGNLDEGAYTYESTAGTITFLDDLPIPGVCAVYNFDVTIGVLTDFPRVMTLNRVSFDETCHSPNLASRDLSGIWTSTTSLP